MLHFNKVLERSDFDDRHFQNLLFSVYPEYDSRPLPPHAYHRKVWEVVMSIYTLEAYGKVGGSALGIGAGVERTIYYLTRYMDVTATDLYNDSGIWVDWCKPDMLTHPERYAPQDYEWYPHRLVMQHVDGRQLPYADESFDAVFSASSIEHFGSFADIARSASEVGRVLKRGGVATISTELCLNPREVTDAQRLYDATKFMTRSEIVEHIVAASGLGLVDSLRTKVVGDMDVVEWQDIAADVLGTPHLFVRHVGGCIYTSVHLALRKI